MLGRHGGDSGVFGSIGIHHNGYLHVSDALSVGFKSHFPVFKGMCERWYGVSPEKIAVETYKNSPFKRIFQIQFGFIAGALPGVQSPTRKLFLHPKRAG